MLLVTSTHMLYPACASHRIIVAKDPMEGEEALLEYVHSSQKLSSAKAQGSYKTGARCYMRFKCSLAFTPNSSQWSDRPRE